MPVAADPRITVVRMWMGRTPRARADEYEAYLQAEGIPPLEDEALAVESLRQDGEVETQFVTISYWASEADMAAFTGGDPFEVHHLARDPEFLVELPDRVQVLRVVSSNWNARPTVQG